MAILGVVQIVKAKVAQTLAAAAGGGDSFPNTGKELFAIRNAGAGSINVTFTAPNPDNFGITNVAHDNVVAVPNDSTVYLIGPFEPNRFNDANGRVQVSYSGVTSLTVNPFSLPPAG